MAQSIGNLAVIISGNFSGLTKALKGATGELASFAKQAASVATGMAVFEGAKSLFGFLVKPLTLATSMEDMLVDFEVMTGSAEKAKKLMEDLQQFSRATPFQTQPLAEATQLLMAFGFEADDILGTLRVLGDISGGNSQKMQELAYNLGQVKSQGKAMTQDINAFAMRGVPIWKELEQIFGKSNTEIRKMVETGAVGFNHIAMALNNAAASGSKFGGLMDKRSQTLTGLLSTLAEDVDIALRGVGEMFLKAFDAKGIINQLSGLTGWVQQNIGALRPVFESVGAVFKATFDTLAAGLSTAGGLFQPLIEQMKVFRVDTQGVRKATLDLLETITSSFLAMAEAVGDALAKLATELRRIAQVMAQFDASNWKGALAILPANILAGGGLGGSRGEPIANPLAGLGGAARGVFDRLKSPAPTLRSMFPGFWGVFDQLFAAPKGQIRLGEAGAAMPKIKAEVDEVKLAAVMLQGTRDAYSVISQHMAQGELTGERAQLQEQRRMAETLKRIEKLQREELEAIQRSFNFGTL